jgi:F-type H+-transporting ATPase subunit epsilon
MSFDLNVVTPEGEAFDGPVETVVLPGAEGDFGVLEGHEEFLSGLRVGEMTLRTAAGEELHAVVGSGFAEVHGNRVVVMVGTCEFAHEIDLDRAKVAHDRALKQLEELRATPDGKELYDRYQEEYSQALHRIAVRERYGR